MIVVFTLYNLCRVPIKISICYVILCSFGVFCFIMFLCYKSGMHCCCVVNSPTLILQEGHVTNL